MAGEVQIPLIRYLAISTGSDEEKRPETAMGGGFPACETSGFAGAAALAESSRKRRFFAFHLDFSSNFW